MIIVPNKMSFSLNEITLPSIIAIIGSQETGKTLLAKNLITQTNNTTTTYISGIEEDFDPVLLERIYSKQKVNSTQNQIIILDDMMYNNVSRSPILENIANRCLF